jgi:hypothetical protein
MSSYLFRGTNFTKHHVEPHFPSEGAASDVAAALERRYGLLMSSDEVRALLKYKSASALSMARKRGHVALTPQRLPGRRKLMFLTSEVAESLRFLVWPSPTPGKEVAMDP